MHLPCVAAVTSERHRGALGGYFPRLNGTQIRVESREREHWLW